MNAIADTLEKQFLLDRVRSVCASGHAQHANAFAGLDWRRLERIANRHRVFPLLHRAVSRTGDELPAADWERYHARFGRLARSNLRHSAELITVLRILERGGIEAIPLKGPLLGQILHGTPSLRQFRDLDVLVPSEKFVRATECLEADGYRLIWPPVHGDSARKLAVMRHFDEQNFTFTHPARRMKLELHWQFMRSGRQRDAYERAAFARRVDIPFCGRHVSSLEPHDLLLLLCTHGAGHAWMRLSWLADLARFLETAGRGLDWEVVWDRAGQARCRRRLLFGLHMAEQVLHAHVPDAVRRRMQADSEVLSRAAARTAPLQEMPRPPAAPRMVAYQVSLKDSRADSLKYLFAWIFKPRENVVGSAVLPAALFPLYYVFWPVQVILWPVRKLFRRRPADPGTGHSPAR